MKKALLLLLICCMIPIYPLKKQKTKRTKGWRLKNKRIAVQNMPNERMRHFRERAKIQAQQEEDKMMKCLDYTKGIVSIVASLTAIGISVATFIVAVAV